MPRPLPLHALYLGLLLALLMAVTRSHHFATPHHLPDASGAILLLAGFYLRPVWVFLALCALAAGIDYAAIAWGGVSDYCVTPAYALLLPAYALLWAAGRGYARHHRDAWSTLPLLIATALVATVGADLLASGGFYLLGGRIPDPSLAGLVAHLARYLPHTLAVQGFYLGLAALAHAVFVGIGSRTAPARGR